MKGYPPQKKYALTGRLVEQVKQTVKRSKPPEQKGGVSYRTPFFPVHPFMIRAHPSNKNQFIVGWGRDQDWYPFSDSLFFPNGYVHSFSEPETITLSPAIEYYQELDNGLFSFELIYEYDGDSTVELYGIASLPEDLDGGNTVLVATVLCARTATTPTTVMQFLRAYNHLSTYSAGGGGGGGIPAKVTGGTGRTCTGDLYANGVDEDPTAEDVTIKLYEMNSEHAFRGWVTVTKIGDHYEGGVEVWQ